MKDSDLLAFPLTPFGDDDTVDRDVFARHLEDQLDHRRAIGPDEAMSPGAWFVACGTGEFSALSLDEYRVVVETAVEVIDGRAPVYAGIGGGPMVAREFARTAEASGANGLLLLPPYLVSSTPRGLVGHVRYVAGATGLPVVVYQRANAVLDPDAVKEMLDIANVSGIKDGLGDLDSMARIIAAVRTGDHPRASSFGFFNGLPTAELSVPAYRAMGVNSYSSAVLAFAPDIALAYYAAVVEGDEVTRSRLLQRFYLPLTQLRQQVPGYAVSLVKAAARLGGLAMGPVRPPLVEPTPEHLSRLERILDDGRSAL